MHKNVGFIKLHRNLRNSFSTDKKLNIELWMLYVFLAEQAAWFDHDDIKRGEIKIKSRNVQDEIFPNLYLTRIEKLFQILEKKGYITTRFVSDIKKEGRIITICNYDSFSGESTEKRVELNWNSTETQLELANIDKHSISLDNSNVKMTTWNSTETQLELNRNSSYYIEKEYKEEKEGKEDELNSLQNFADAKSLAPLIINNDPPIKVKKERKPKPDVDHKDALDTFYREYEKRYGVKPLINAKVIRHLKDIIKRCGKDASRLIAFYLSHNNSFYLSKAHQIEYALKDCEKLYTEMTKNDYIFAKDAKKIEDATANSILLDQILARNRKERNE